MPQRKISMATYYSLVTKFRVEFYKYPIKKENEKGILILRNKKITLGSLISLLQSMT